MAIINITNCPGTLATDHTSYSSTCLRRVFNGKKVNHILPYQSPLANVIPSDILLQNRKIISISGVQEKFSVLLDKNKLRLTREGERGSCILKPIPNVAKNTDQMPANEQLTMQLARQVYGIETAENALVFFQNGDPAYITKRFDIKKDGSKLALEDFASVAQKSPQTHGPNYKYEGTYMDMFQLMKEKLPSYTVEAPKLFTILIFNYLFSNGDAHLKNFSLLETPLGDFRLSPAYDLLNTRIHVDDDDFALKGNLLDKKLSQTNIFNQFVLLADLAGISQALCNSIFDKLLSKSDKVERLIQASFLNEKTKRNYLQAYKARFKKLMKYRNQ